MCLGSSSLFIVYSPWWTSFIPIVPVLPPELMTSKSLPWPSPDIQISICIWICYKHLKLYTPPDPEEESLPIHAPLLPALSRVHQAFWIRWLRLTLDSYSLSPKKFAYQILKILPFQHFRLWLLLHHNLFGPSFLLSGFVEWLHYSLFTNPYHKHPAGNTLTLSWSRAHSAYRQKTNLFFFVAFKSLNTLVPRGFLT